MDIGHKYICILHKKSYFGIRVNRINRRLSHIRFVFVQNLVLLFYAGVDDVF